MKSGFGAPGFGLFSGLATGLLGAGLFIEGLLPEGLLTDGLSGFLSAGLISGFGRLTLPGLETVAPLLLPEGRLELTLLEG